MKKVRSTVAFLALCFVLSFSVIPQNVLAAKKKVKLSKKISNGSGWKDR